MTINYGPFQIINTITAARGNDAWLRVNFEELDKLQTLLQGHSYRVFCIAGKARQGKSTLVNFILTGSSSVPFQANDLVGSQGRPVTNGVWAYFKAPSTNSETGLLVLDFEGAFGTDQVVQRYETRNRTFNRTPMLIALSLLLGSLSGLYYRETQWESTDHQLICQAVDLIMRMDEMVLFKALPVNYLDGLTLCLINLDIDLGSRNKFYNSWKKQWEELGIEKEAYCWQRTMKDSPDFETLKSMSRNLVRIQTTIKGIRSLLNDPRNDFPLEGIEDVWKDPVVSDEFRLDLASLIKTIESSTRVFRSGTDLDVCRMLRLLDNKSPLTSYTILTLLQDQAPPSRSWSSLPEALRSKAQNELRLFFKIHESLQFSGSGTECGPNVSNKVLDMVTYYNRVLIRWFDDDVVDTYTALIRQQLLADAKVEKQKRAQFLDREANSIAQKIKGLLLGLYGIQDLSTLREQMDFPRMFNRLFGKAIDKLWFKGISQGLDPSGEILSIKLEEVLTDEAKKWPNGIRIDFQTLLVRK